MVITSAFKFLQEVKEELAKVTWPSRKETIRLTVIVLTVSVITGAFIGGLDYFLNEIMEVVLKTF